MDNCMANDSIDKLLVSRLTPHHLDISKYALKGTYFIPLDGEGVTLREYKGSPQKQ